ASSTSAPSPASGGVVVRTARSEQPISVGADPGPGAGLSLSGAELARIFTTDTGTITFGDSAQTGAITFAAASPATTAPARVAAPQAVGGPGAIVLAGGVGTALAAASGDVRLSAGAGGIVAFGAAPSIASTGRVTLDAGGDVGASGDVAASGHRVLFDAGATPADLSVGIGGHLTEGAVYPGGLGN